MSIMDDLLKKLSATVTNALRSSAVKVKSDINQGIDNAVKNAKQKSSIRKKTVKFDTLPQNAEEMKAMPIYDQKDEYVVAACTVAALLRYAAN